MSTSMIRQRLDRLEAVASPASDDTTAGRIVLLVGGAYREDDATIAAYLRAEGVTMTNEDMIVRQSAAPASRDVPPFHIESISRRTPTNEFVHWCLSQHYADGSSIGDHTGA